MNYAPQLPTEVPERDLEALLRDDRWAMSQKLDGHRFVVQTGPLCVYNRHGDEREIPRALTASLGSIEATWVLDGEFLDNTLHVFDIISTSRGDIDRWPWQKRQEMVKAVVPKIADLAGGITTVQQVYGENSKRAFYEQCKNAMVEGVVFARTDAAYQTGKRTKNLYKFKFIKQVDCVVTGKSLDGKDNLEIAVYRDGELVNVGRVSAQTGDGPNVGIGDVVTVDTLYSTQVGRLFHPVKPRIRTDKSANECSYDQIESIRTNKEIIND